MAQVAADVGFHDQAHFTKHFKRHVGTTWTVHSAVRRLISSPEPQVQLPDSSGVATEDDGHSQGGGRSQGTFGISSGPTRLRRHRIDESKKEVVAM